MSATLRRLPGGPPHQLSVADAKDTRGLALFQEAVYMVAFDTLFVCGKRNHGEALLRIAEGAAMIRTR